MASTLTPADVREARATLGRMWGLGRPLRAAELARELRLTGRDPGRTVLDWEKGQRAVTGPVAVAIEALLTGWRPTNEAGT